MKLLNFFTVSTLVTNGRASLTPTKKICRDCIHFIGNDMECKKFGDTNIISGRVTYPSARSVREDEKKCGENAILFEENHFKMATVPYYFLKENWKFFAPVGLWSLYVWALLPFIFKH